MNDYTRGAQDGLKAAAEKWAERCARAESKLAELERRIAYLEASMESFIQRILSDGFFDD